jgi:hypothetical protein
MFPAVGGIPFIFYPTNIEINEPAHVGPRQTRRKQSRELIVPLPFALLKKASRQVRFFDRYRQDALVLSAKHPQNPSTRVSTILL